jgi:putative membrane protein
MTSIAQVLVGLVAVLHLGFLALEMFYWNTPRGRAVFGTTREFAAESATLAANQGLYNGFLSAGLVWGLIAPDPVVGFQFQVFFLICVIVAGLYGARTVSSRILFIQATPAGIALFAVLLGQ